MTRLQVIDSHTAGEPTRVVLEGGPDLGSGPLSERAATFSREHDAFRSAVVNEPRGSDVLVAALLVPPHGPGCDFGVIFFNNVGTIGMCGHGTIGLVATLAHAGKIAPGSFRIDTPVGPVTAELLADGRVSVRNVPSFRQAAGVTVEVPGIGPVTGDLAWGGNWFFLVTSLHPELKLARVEELTATAWAIRQAVNAQGFPEVDHIELFGPPGDSANHSRNFVLCPGKAYDRSPCGTGTSAKIACLAADGKLAPGDIWRQESILGTVFEASYEIEAATGADSGREEVGDGQIDTEIGRIARIVPTISGRAWITAESTLLFDPTDPFRDGIRVADEASAASADS
ncbi:MAG: proline racemase family protein [Verrucomicrobiota bacterium]